MIVITYIGWIMAAFMFLVFILSVIIVGAFAWDGFRQWREERKLRPGYPSIRQQAKTLDDFANKGDENGGW